MTIWGLGKVINVTKSITLICISTSEALMLVLDCNALYSLLAQADFSIILSCKENYMNQHCIIPFAYIYLYLYKVPL